MNIVYEDNHVLVVDKPAGLLTQPSGTKQENLEDRCKQWLKDKYNKPGAVYIHAIHRLDKQVSGLVLFAKTSKALSRLNESMRTKEPAKIYLALVEGSLPQSEGILENYLIHDSHHARISSQDNPQAKVARLRYVIIKRSGNRSLVEITLETGRYHQIRVQLSAAGAPIVGDIRYGSKTKLDGDAIALHHHRLSFRHPVSGESLAFESLPIWRNME